MTRLQSASPATARRLLEGLTPEQARAVTHAAGPLMVVAGPGSGKTTVIARRIGYLIAVRGVDPRSLLVITFTKAAADELKARAAGTAGPAAARAFFGTFHGLAYRMLRHAQGGGPLRILLEDQQFQLIRNLMRTMGLNTDDEAVQEVLADLSRLRAEPEPPAGFRPRSLRPAEFDGLLRRYAEAKAEQGLLDFDDLLHEALALLRGRPELLEGYRRRFGHILVDEFQDTNPVQFALVRLLAEPGRNLCVVGDDDQAIYGWRGATPEFLLSFGDLYPGAAQVILAVNHRCPAPVVEAANRLVAHNVRRLGKVMRPVRRSGPPVRLLTPADTVEEAEVIARLVREAGAPLSHWAVIYRTNQQAHVLAEVLSREGIPYRTLGGLPNLYRRWPVQDVLAYLRAAAGDRMALLPVLNRPNRYLARAVAEEAARIAGATDGDLLAAIGRTGLLRTWQLRPVEELEDHLRALGRMTAPEAIAYVRSVIGYDDYLQEYAARAGGRPDELLGLLAEVQRTAPRLLLPAYLGHVAAFSAQADRKAPEGQAVTLVTCHRAKGLEFPRVVVAGAVDRLLPHRSNPDVEEERRLMYVAVTRAREELWISAPRSYEGRECRPSPFVAELLGTAAFRAAEAGTAD